MKRSEMVRQAYERWNEDGSYMFMTDLSESEIEIILSYFEQAGMLPPNRALEHPNLCTNHTWELEE